ncbi:beta-lactamase family protein [Bacillus sp. BRMEA1]|uniref:serine hydrolase domain-containing protein n=1 Tax=Neobacillus endophyticus TaxID=2738405 RepID=UPI001566AD9B|nr:serine hydrolase domain-containing protein [Neobacillus endophyticus]NRD79504.1 beta-lactamase family protein [Neobacillus endophyticus]
MADFQREQVHTPMSRQKKRRRLKPFVRRFLYLLVIVAGILLIPKFFHHSETAKLKEPKSVHQSVTKKPQSNTNEMTKVQDINNAPVIDQYLKSLNFNGSVLVVKNGTVLVNKGYGYADMETKRSNNSSTVFYIGSITKVFISTAVMQLQEKGLLNIHDPLAKYLPDFPNARKITLYNLLTHTSGIPEHSETTEPISHDDLIKKIAKGHLKFPPGTMWNYSDSNYSILGYIIEKLTQEPLEQYVTTHIFKQAGLEHTGFGKTYIQEPYQANGYKIKNKQMISTTLPDMSQLFACGDIYTTPYDMYLFDKALYNGKLISAASLKVFFTPFKHNYALGMYRDPGSYSDHGVLPGWNVLNSFSRNGNNFVVLFSNVQNGVKSLGVVNNQIYLLLKNIHINQTRS